MTHPVELEAAQYFKLAAGVLAAPGVAQSAVLAPGRSYELRVIGGPVALSPGGAPISDSSVRVSSAQSIVVRAGGGVLAVAAKTTVAAELWIFPLARAAP